MESIITLPSSFDLNFKLGTYYDTHIDRAIAHAQSARHLPIQAGSSDVGGKKQWASACLSNDGRQGHQVRYLFVVMRWPKLKKDRETDGALDRRRLIFRGDSPGRPTRTLREEAEVWADPRSVPSSTDHAEGACALAPLRSSEHDSRPARATGFEPGREEDIQGSTFRESNREDYSSGALGSN